MHDKKEIILEVRHNQIFVTARSAVSQQEINITPVFHFLKQMFQELGADVCEELPCKHESSKG